MKFMVKFVNKCWEYFVLMARVLSPNNSFVRELPIECHVDLRHSSHLQLQTCKENKLKKLRVRNK